MKKLIGWAAALLLLGGLGISWADQVVDYGRSLGKNREDDVASQISVLNTDEAGTTLVNGDVVVWDLRSATNTSNDNRWSVTTTTIAANPLVAGVMVSDSTAANRYGYLQVSGIHAAIRTTGLIEPTSQGLETSTTRGLARGAVAPKHPLAKPFTRVGSGTSTVYGDIQTK